MNCAIRKKQKLFPTLAGYRLSPKELYTIWVQTQERSAEGWNIYLAPPTCIELLTGEQEGFEGNRQLDIRVRGYEHYLDFFRRPTVNLPITLRFSDGRPPHQFDIPIVLGGRWRYFFLFIPFAGIAPLISVPYRIVPHTNLVLLIGLGLALLAIIPLLYGIWELIRLYGNAQNFLTQRQQEWKHAFGDRPATAPDENDLVD